MKQKHVVGTIIRVSGLSITLLGHGGGFNQKSLMNKLPSNFHKSVPSKAD